MKLAVITLLVFMSGCAQIAKFEKRSDEQVARFIGHLCEETDETYRHERLLGINKLADPDSVSLTCGER